MIDDDTESDFLPGGSRRCDTTWVGPPATRCTSRAVTRLMYLPTEADSREGEIQSGVLYACAECVEDFKKHAGTRGYPFMVEEL